MISVLLVTPNGKYNDSFQTGKQFRLFFRGTLDLVVAQQHWCTAEQVALTLIYYSVLPKILSKKQKKQTNTGTSTD